MIRDAVNVSDAPPFGVGKIVSTRASRCRRNVESPGRTPSLFHNSHQLPTLVFPGPTFRVHEKLL